MINILIADDDFIIREGLKMLLSSQPDFHIIDTAENGRQAVTKCRENTVDVAVLDIRMPEMNGIEAAQFLLTENLARPLLLTTFDEEDFIIQALKLGVGGYILKNSPPERIFNAIRTVSTGGNVFQEDVLQYIRGRVGGGKKQIFALLSQREQEIVELIAKGLSNQEIADQLYLSNGTVRNHISAILEKTGLEHRTQIAVKYLGD
jgi:DNA-binding NarL/FixJ family response regulator